MKYKTLHVEKFGPISEATVELRAVNMFIGQQSIGKSTLAKLITIFTDNISLCKLINGGTDVWETLLKEYGLDVYREDDYRIEFEMHEDELKFILKAYRGKVACFIMEGDKRITNRSYISDKIVDFIKIYHTEEVAKKMLSGIKTEEILDLFTNSLYIPAERIIYSVLTNLFPALILAKSAIPQNLLRFMVDLDNAKVEYPDFPIKLLDIAFKHEGSDDSIVLNVNERPIPMKAASSGIQSLVPLLLVLHYALNKREYSSFVIEEPECNLFPTKQVDLLKEILKMVKGNSRILTITTHSPYLLSAMNNILFAGMLVKKYGDDIRSQIDEIIPVSSMLNASECSVYSLGTDINEGGVYCRSLIDDETGMIDFNSLDQVSEQLGEEFDRLQTTMMDFLSQK